MHSFYSRTPLLAVAVCAALTLSGCASWRNALSPSASQPVTPAQAAADADQSAASANAGAQTTSATSLQKFLWIFKPYRPDIQQGNFVSQEMLAQLKVGQTREQVKFILGTPLLTDVFHTDRWDFPFYLARGNGELTKARVTIYFKDDKVERFDGGNLPTEREYIARIAGPAKAAAKEAPKKEEAGSASIQIRK
ncbi:outer membrane protein assembly factor BamE domain-containing protein [Massilia sp. TWR1-2-2]|uniref:outer membrane protein assembly factor BamE n=1 Tax=Massilia sp. TWR1-2-2 TaxID=2804584 RepID=UPI003CFB2F62